jgi:hypothetical protein
LQWGTGGASFAASAGCDRRRRPDDHPGLSDLGLSMQVDAACNGGDIGLRKVLRDPLSAALSVFSFASSCLLPLVNGLRRIFIA